MQMMGGGGASFMCRGWHSNVQRYGEKRRFKAIYFKIDEYLSLVRCLLFKEVKV